MWTQLSTWNIKMIPNNLQTGAKRFDSYILGFWAHDHLKLLHSSFPTKEVPLLMQLTPLFEETMYWSYSYTIWRLPYSTVIWYHGFVLNPRLCLQHSNTLGTQQKRWALRGPSGLSQANFKNKPCYLSKIRPWQQQPLLPGRKVHIKF